jgi:hypothetical protein
VPILTEEHSISIRGKTENIYSARELYERGRYLQLVNVSSDTANILTVSRNATMLMAKVPSAEREIVMNALNILTRHWDLYRESRELMQKLRDKLGTEKYLKNERRIWAFLLKEYFAGRDNPKPVRSRLNQCLRIAAGKSA